MCMGQTKRLNKQTLTPVYKSNLLMYFKLTTLSAAVVLCLTSQAQAQTLIRPDAGSTLQQQGAQPLTVPRAAPQVLPQGFAPKPALDALPSASVPVKAVTFTGNTVFTSAELAPLIANLVGSTASLTELNNAAGKVRSYYRERGYFLAQAYLPRQDVTAGTIEITVLEAYVGKVKATSKPATRLKETVAQSVLNANLKPDSVITESSLERPLLILSDMPGVAVKSSLGSGNAIGTADIDVEVSNTSAGFVTGSIDADNHGSTFTGAYRLGANLVINNATGYGDKLTARAQIALENTRSNLARIAWQTPLGYYGTQVGVSYTKLNYLLIKDFAALQAEGDASIASAFIAHPIVRSRGFNLNAQLGYDSKRLEDRVLSVASTETRSINNTRIGLQGDWRDSLAGGGLNIFSLGLTNGKLSINQAAVAAADQAPGGANTQGAFSKTNVDLLRLQTVTNEFSLLGSLNAQFASRNLPSAEKMSLGGPNGGSGVRAYPVGEASGDQGYVGTFEARYTNPAWSIANAATTVSAFYDYGSITISKNPLPGLASNNNNRSLKGAGFGVTLAKDGDFSLKAALAWRLGNNKPLSGADRMPRFWLQASKAF